MKKNTCEENSNPWILHEIILTYKEKESIYDVYKALIPKNNTLYFQSHNMFCFFFKWTETKALKGKAYKTLQWMLHQ